MALFDNVAALFSAKAAARRDAHRLSSLVTRQVHRELVTRGYDASRATRQTWGWLAPSTSANAEVFNALISLRNRSSDLVRNNPHASKAKRVIVNNAVGTGISVVARTGNKRLDKKVNDLWTRFVDECDYGGQFDFFGLQRLSCGGMLERGESVTRLRPAPKKKIPIELQLLEGDYIDHRKNAGGNGKLTFMGVEFTEGKRSGYYLFRDHPGEFPFTIPQSYVSDYIPADQVLHLYEAQRIGQVRGIPYLTPGLILARDIETYREAERVRKRIEACVAGIVFGADEESQEGIAPKVVDANGEKVEQFEPGLIAIARGAKDIKFTQPAQNGAYSDAMRTEYMALAAAWDITYDQLTSDLRQANFSSLKAGKAEFRLSMSVLQWTTFIPMQIKPIWKAFIDYSIIAGLLPANTPYGHECTTPKFEPLDAVKENAGDIDAVRGFLMPPQEAIRRRGYDPDTVLADHKAWHDALVLAGLVSDADPSLAAKAGVSPNVTPQGQTGDDE